MRLPDELAHLQNDDLVAKLSRLTVNQVRGIAAIIASGYHTEAIICPRHLLFGEERICTTEMMYRAGKWSEERQAYTVTPGWSRQPAFMEALNLAKRLALRYDVDEEFIAVRQTNRRARLASPDIMQEMIRIARDQPSISSISSTDAGPIQIVVDNSIDANPITPRDQIAAATLVLKHAALDAIPDDDGDNPEADWWKAAEEDA